jgi:hypothetical protein
LNFEKEFRSLSTRPIYPISGTGKTKEIERRSLPMSEESGEGEGLVLKGVTVLKGMFDKGQGGITYTSDQITYPDDLKAVPDDLTRSGGSMAACIGKRGYVYASDNIWFRVQGQFREYDQTILGDPNSVTTPVMANVYVDLEESEKAGLTELEIHFTALRTPYGTAEDPKIRFVCDGRYDPAGTGDTRFRSVLEIDQKGYVNVIEHDVTGGDGVMSDDSPNGFFLTIADS